MYNIVYIGHLNFDRNLLYSINKIFVVCIVYCVYVIYRIISPRGSLIEIFSKQLNNALTSIERIFDNNAK